MSGRNFAAYAPMDQRVIDLERQVAHLTRLVESLSRAREARIIGSGAVVEAYAGESDADIALNATGTVSRWGDPWISMSNKYTDTGINDTVRTIIGPIAANKPVLYLRCLGIENLIAWQSKCAT